MIDTLQYFADREHVDLSRKSPIGVNFSRYRILPMFNELGFKFGAEIGTENGIYARKICQANPQLKLYCIDPYMAMPYYRGEKEQPEVDSFYEDAKRRLKPYNAEILRTTSMEAVQMFERDSLDFVFIDGNHNFEFVVNDIIYWSRIVRPGGIVYGHDYWTENGVVQAINAYVKAYEIKPWFVIHAGGKIIDSWMFIRKEGDGVWPSYL